MKSKVFLSCGQRPDETKVANEIRDLLLGRGFDVYVAINAQTIPEINAGIIRELKDSDCYLFINFRRERINRKFGGQYRGSLFSNQELAIAYALGFTRLLIINQRGIMPEGMVRYIGVNTETFNDSDDCRVVVARALDRAADWRPDYTRRLRADNLVFSPDPISYANLAGRFLYVDILNGRPDIAALVATARCAELAQDGQTPRPSPIRSALKATAFRGFSHTIFPKSYEAFDLLCVGQYIPPNVLACEEPERGVFLNTALDVVSPPRLPIALGIWQLRYEFFAIDFPILSVWIELNVTDWNNPSAKILKQDVI
jgi:hypothetical protein